MFIEIGCNRILCIYFLIVIMNFQCSKALDTKEKSSCFISTTIKLRSNILGRKITYKPSKIYKDENCGKVTFNI